MPYETTITETSSHRRFEQRHDRYTEVQSTRMDVRRVTREDGCDEVQIELTLSKHFPRTGRSAAQHASFCMNSADAALFAGAILELHERSVRAAKEAKRQAFELRMEKFRTGQID